MELLVRRGADVNARSKGGETPLMVKASDAGRLEVMEAFKKHGAR